MKEPVSFEDLLEKFLSGVCVKHGYCLTPQERFRIIYEIDWEDECRFVEQLMLSDGVNPKDRPKHLKAMSGELTNLIENHGRQFLS